MKLMTKLAIGTAFMALAACGSSNNANNSADMNAGTDLNATTTDMNATDVNAGGATDMNATGNTSLNAAGGASNSNGSAGTTTNNGM